MKNSIIKVVAHIIGAVFVFFIFPSITYSCFVNTELHSQIDKHSYQLDSISKIQQKDSLSVDSFHIYDRDIKQMNQQILRLEDNYTSYVDLMIEKTSAWMAYWMGIFALIMTIPTIVYLFQNHNHEKRIEKTIEEFNNKKKEIDDKLKELQKEIEKESSEQKNEIENRLKKEKEYLKQDLNSFINNVKNEFTTTKNNINKNIEESKNERKRLQKSIKENRINAIMMCLSSFPDPQMVSEKSEKRNMISKYLNLLNEEFKEYADLVCEQVFKKDCSYKEIKDYTCLVLMSIKMAVIRSQCTYPELNQNIAFYCLIQIIDEESKAIDCGKISQEDLKKTLCKIRDSFQQVIECIRSL